MQSLSLRKRRAIPRKVRPIPPPIETVWRLADEPSADLDDSKVQSILSALAGYVTAQITDADPSAYGFAAPLATVRAASADGTVTSTTPKMQTAAG